VTFPLSKRMFLLFFLLQVYFMLPTFTRVTLACICCTSASDEGNCLLESSTKASQEENVLPQQKV